MKQENSETAKVPTVHGISYLDGVIVPFYVDQFWNSR